jgi:hypothetical protein
LTVGRCKARSSDVGTAQAPFRPNRFSSEAPAPCSRTLAGLASIVRRQCPDVQMRRFPTNPCTKHLYEGPGLYQRRTPCF